MTAGQQGLGAFSTQPGGMGAAGPPGPPGSSALPSYIWRPGGVPSATVLTTWADVEVVIAANSGSVLILVDPSIAPANVPAGADTECFGRVMFQSYTFSGLQTVMTIDDGARLRNPFMFRNVLCDAAPTVLEAIQVNIAGGIIFVDDGGALRMTLGATLCMVRYAAASCQLVRRTAGGLENNSGNPAIGTVQVDDGYTLLHVAFQSPGLLSSEIFFGSVTASMFNVWDASATPVTQTLFAGTIGGFGIDQAVGVQYDDAAVAPPLGATQVQAAIDALKGLVGGGSYPLPVVVVAASQAAPAGFTYVLSGDNIVLTLQPGVVDDVVRVLNTGVGNSVVADGTAPDLIFDDAGTAQATFNIDDTRGGSATYPRLREWQFASGIGNFWIRTLTQHFASFLEGTLLSQEWVSPNPAKPGFTSIITTAGETIETPDPTTVGSGPSARFAIVKFAAGALTINAFAGSQFMAPDGSGFVTTYNADEWPAGTYFEWQYGLSSNTYVLTAVAPAPNGARVAFGALLPLIAVGQFMQANGNTTSAAVPVLGLDAEYPLPISAPLRRLAWRSLSADATTQLDLYQNGAVVDTITLTGASGSVDLTAPLVCAAGDLLAMAYAAGTAPDGILAVLG